MNTLPIEEMVMSQTTGLRVGRFDLRPFCLAHLLRFEEIDDADPFFTDANDWPRNVFYAILICQCTFEKLLLLEANPRLYRKHARKVHRFLKGSQQIIPLAQDICQWVTSAVQFPASTKTDRGQKCGKSNSPWFQNMSVTLRKTLGMSESDVMNRPIQSNIVDWYSILESEEVLSLDSREDFVASRNANDFAEGASFEDLMDKLKAGAN